MSIAPIRAKCIVAIALTSVICETVAGSGCDAVVQYAGRNFTYEERDNATAEDIYNNECNGSIARDAGGFRFDAALQQLPVKFGIGGNSSSERITNFCKTYTDLRKMNSVSITNTNLVAEQSVRAWLECKRLSDSGADFQPVIQDTQFAVTVKHVGGPPLVVMQPTFDSTAARCTVSSQTLFGNKAVTVDADTRFTLSNDESATITCIRTPVINKDGSKVYPKVDFLLATNRTQAFSLPIPADALLPQMWAANIQGQIDVLRQTYLNSSKEIDTRFKKILTPGRCTSVEAKSRWQETETYACAPGQYLRLMRFHHKEGENFTYQESIELECCPLFGT